LSLTGSPSAPLAMTTGRRPVMAAILRPVGNPAPPAQPRLAEDSDELVGVGGRG